VKAETDKCAASFTANGAGRAQFNDARSDTPDVNVSVRLETRPRKPMPHETNFRLEATLPEVAMSLNF
jgi:hypothetical protein